MFFSPVKKISFKILKLIEMLFRFKGILKKLMDESGMLFLFRSGERE